MSMLSRPHPLRNRNSHSSQPSTATLTASPSYATLPRATDADLAPPSYSPPPYTPKITSSSSIPSSSSVTTAFETKVTISNPTSAVVAVAPTNRKKSSSINPLDIPEILVRVGQFIPLWLQYRLDYCARFYPQTLVRATQVSRLWYSVLTPLLWYFFDDSHHVKMTSLPRPVILRNAHWIRVLHQRHVASASFCPSSSSSVAVGDAGQNPGFFDGCCCNLIQLTTSPWVVGIEDLLRLNKRLEKFSWQTHATFSTVPKSVYDAMAGIDLKGRPLPGGGLTRLRELEFVGCQLDPLLLFPVLRNHLPRLRTVIFQDVVFTSTPMVPKATEPGKTPTLASLLAATESAIVGSGSGAGKGRELRTKYNLAKLIAFPQIHELRFGKGMQKVRVGEWLVDFVLCCPNLESLILESDDQHSVPSWDSSLNGMNSNFNRLIANLEFGCWKLRNIEYRPSITFGKGPNALTDIQYSRLVDCISVTSVPPIPGSFDNNVAHSSSSNSSHNKSALLSDISERDLNQDPIPPVSFKADMNTLDSLTTSSLCKLGSILEIVSLRLHRFEYLADIQSNATNALKILTSCPNLVHFSLEYYSLGSVQTPLVQPETILSLFSQDWVCSGLKVLILDGIKRQVMDESRKRSERRRTDGRMSLTIPGQRNYVPIKMKDLLAIAGLDSCSFVTQIYNSDRRDMIEGMEALQQKMFRQLTLLKNLKELRLNGETFCDFTKLAGFAR